MDIKNQLLSLIDHVVETNEENIVKNKAKGEYFNLIKIMGMATSEVHTHTPIIADLLNPKGSHGQGSIFLKIFVEYFSLNFDIDTKVIVEREKRERKDQIDILIRNDHQIMIIENKIYASDQSKQLNRYYSYCIAKNKQPILIYLSLLDAQPSKKSLGHILRNEEDGCYYLNGDITQPVDLSILNYQNDLLGWLSEIEQYLNDQTNILAAIQQYKNLVLQMTGNIMSNKSAIKELLLSVDSKQFKAISDINHIFQSQEFRGELLERFFSEIDKSFNHYQGYSISLDGKYNNVRHDLSKCKRWFKNVQKSRRMSRDFIGCIFEHQSVPLLKFMIIVVTEGLHYGVVCEDNNINLKDIINDSLWSFQSNKNKLEMSWMSKLVCNIRNFDSITLDLLVTQDNELFDSWIGEVIANFNSVIEEFKQLDEAK
ncbi:PD-(D/E)XK nuclease family protein [Acinetobacter sp. VNH17]|uniref:PD-(D/E)XK nuclease family protein n=1 Tax=Acinetobacter thutiue TaxID=2998078 RepID=A0ABT7WK29_9GAMM|nr:PD-(D/E)XK nuclease family protein [Acinetobacter thutiue]MCY6410909.1 PD-(D/E)XK nuclease family protein [Acinetobacter thutiue]MDN0013011.1 PD-(D/E)XK nuclease family protein [Acinetobacter thutiue]